ncbi:HAD-IC family P-type ATPase [Pediococcus claussenii]|uniref:HAD ATPase, P-type, IC family protein n=1 Tax=Pediococcus claussenii (strain ATCC BAA-344 / DSM 14800 / JCM 18046 / KCTC 3811 / LMG 21948 / P06) TaxID=701521 RepID=G8PBU5_PEDCP|nr:HAD-IC family P-type ATPase [Pediococcus claussenii]AEV96003.1 HAD ATPase, P-type, IC family protein [Pediococcus claussenii ATCC BAA-344]ANZ69489.1 proton-efflux P-type ATPase [Pediococcus claussenii]ANZ71308.1 proton-efflux P-type ATPase [Pediococcus claussenii]KRN20609.1 hypothetical protein IV79_GL000668 [Pediococcus claussenii]
MKSIKNTGLSQKEAQKLLDQNGLNEVKLPIFKFWNAIGKRLWEPSAWVLEAALLIEFFLGKGVQAGFIVLMLLFAAINGAIQSRRANIVLGSLSEQLEPIVSVKRDNCWQQISSKELVVGDLINLKQGDLVPADAQLISEMLDLDESSVTGESKEVHYEVGQVVSAGTEVISGHSFAIVTAVGSNSRYGKTVSLIKRSSAPGHLQVLLGKVIGYLAILDAVLAVILIVMAILRHENIIEMLPFLAMLFIATIPIAMPSSFAVANSVEAKELSKHAILVSDLVGIQEAANVNLLLVDKTGTITTNKPEVVLFKNLSKYPDQIVVDWAVHATDFQSPSVIDRAIQNYEQKTVEPKNDNDFTPFSPEQGYSANWVNSDSGKAEVKLGSFDRLNSLTSNVVDLSDVNFELGRSVALSLGDQLIGIFILQDQPRSDSLKALQEIQKRGVKVIMLTGDNQLTAAAIAKQVGLSGDFVSLEKLIGHNDLTKTAGVANVRPENKLEIVEHFQKNGYIVGMTGDGVNDASALKQADVGIAVQNATDLAKRSAKIVLMTEGLAPIVQVLDSGHRVYQRMMTWTITKLSRTSELTLLLTIGYLFFHVIPLTINAMILVAILNDMVTLVLGTDNTVITKQPERWNILKLGKMAGILAFGWTLVGLGLLTVSVQNGFSVNQISTILYNYLIFSAMMTIFITRTSRNFWQSRASTLILSATSGNVVLTIVLSLSGIGVAAIPLLTVSEIGILVVITSAVLDLIYQLVENSI